MTLRHLAVFVCVCETENITKTAEKLNTVQPAISQTIADIEKYYGVTLFNRINRRLKLTEDGRTLFIKAKEVLVDFAEFENAAKNAAENPKISIGVSLTFGKTLLPEIMKYVKENYPHASLFSAINNAKEIQEYISAGKLDFGVIEGAPTYPNIEAVKFKSDKLSVVCGVNYDFPNTVGIDELSKGTLLLRERGSASRDYLENMFSVNNLSCSPTMESISNQAIITAVKENLGIAVLPEDLVKSYISKNRFRQIIIKGTELVRDSYVISYKNKNFGKTVKSIYDKVCEGVFNGYKNV